MSLDGGKHQEDMALDGFESVNLWKEAGENLPVPSSCCLGCGHKRCSSPVTDVDHFKLVKVSCVGSCCRYMVLPIFHFRSFILFPHLKTPGSLLEFTVEW